MRKEIIGAIAVMIAATLWGLDGTVLTPRLFSLDVAFVVFLLHLTPFLLLQPFLYKEYLSFKKFSKKDWVSIFLIALFGGVLGTLSIVKALFLVNFDNLSIILLLQKLQPVFAILLAYIFLKEKMKPKFFIWATLAIIGGYFLTFEFHLPNVATNNLLPAVMYSLLAAFSFGAAVVFGRQFVTNQNFKTASFYRLGLTTIIMGIYVLLSGKMAFGLVTNENIILIFTIALLIGIGSSLIYYFGLTRIKASKSTIYELAFPVSVVVFDFIFNGHILSWVQFIAAAVIVFAIYKISQK